MTVGRFDWNAAVRPVPTRCVNRPPAAKETFEMARDPVCGITLDNRSPYKSSHAGRIHLFCCPRCKSMFDGEPGRYVAGATVAPVALRPASARRASALSITVSIRRFFHGVLPGSMSRRGALFRTRSGAERDRV